MVNSVTMSSRAPNIFLRITKIGGSGMRLPVIHNYDGNSIPIGDLNRKSPI